jgi:hypothetical protein
MEENSNNEVIFRGILRHEELVRDAIVTEFVDVDLWRMRWVIKISSMKFTAGTSY